MDRDQLSRIVYGMSPSEVYLQVEGDYLSEKDLQNGHLVMSAFDSYERDISLYSSTDKIAGFDIKKTSEASKHFMAPFATRPAGLIEASIKETFPAQHVLFTNASVDSGGYVTIRGIHANDLLDHPYVCACFGLLENSIDLLLAVRLKALEILEIPAPTDETLSFMRVTMRHNRPEISRDLEEHQEWLNTLAKTNGTKTFDDLREVARLTFYSREDELSERDAMMMSQRRRRFIDRHPGSERIFGPFPEHDEALAHIRKTVHSEMNMQLVDGVIAKQIGKHLWADFTRNPEAFCSARLEKRVLTEPDNDKDFPSCP